MDHTRGTNDLLRQKLIFQCFKNTPDGPYYSTNIKKECDICDQHTLLYRFVKTMNEKMRKNLFRMSGVTPGTKN
jgi:hypothetical protein